jgi:hypothetical protein
MHIMLTTLTMTLNIPTLNNANTDTHDTLTITIDQQEGYEKELTCLERDILKLESSGSVFIRQ